MVLVKESPRLVISSSIDRLIFRMDKSNATLGRIIEIGWCSFDLKKKEVIDECQIFVKPSNAFILTSEQTAQTGVTQENMMNGLSLKDALARFNDHCYYNYTSHNKTFCLATVGDEILTKLLPSEVRILGIKLPQYFFQFFDILNEFRRTYPQADSVKTTQGMVSYLGLKNITFQNQCQLETKNLVRIINKLAIDEHIFISPKLLNQRHELIRAARTNPGGNKNTSYKKWSGFIRGKSPEPFRIPRDYYIRVRGLPRKADPAELQKRFKAIRILPKNISFTLDISGSFTGDAVIKLLNEKDFKESLSYHLGTSGKHLIEVYEARLEDYEKSKLSADPNSKPHNPLPMIPEGAKIILISGLQDFISDFEIKGLLGNLRLVGDIYRATTNGGLPGSHAAAILNDAKALAGALKLSGTTIKGLVLHIEEIAADKLQHFLASNFIKRDIHWARVQLPHITIEARNRTLVMHSLPEDILYEELLNVFRNDNLAQNGLYVNKTPNGIVASVTFEDETDARRALKTKSTIYLKNKYVELHEMR